MANNTAITIPSSGLLQASGSLLPVSSGQINNNISFGGWIRLDQLLEQYVSYFTFVKTSNVGETDSYAWFGWDSTAGGGFNNRGFSCFINGQGTHSFEPMPANGTWVHFCFTRSGTTWRGYRNGELMTWDSNGGLDYFTISGETNEIDQLRLFNEQASGQNFVGAGKAFFLCNKTLTQAEVRKIMKQKIPGNDIPGFNGTAVLTLTGPTDLYSRIPGPPLIIAGSDSSNFGVTTLGPSSLNYSVEVRARGFGQMFMNHAPIQMFDPITLSWESRVAANGGTVSATTLSATDAAVRTLKANSSLWTKINNGSSRLSFMAGNNLNAAMVPLIKGGGGNTDIPNNVTNSDYSLSTGISGNGSNKTVDIDITANQAGQSTGSACTMMLCPKEAANTIYQMFWSDEANYEEAYCLGNADKKAFVHAGTYLEETMNTNSRRGLWGINATGSYMMTYRNGRTRRPFPVLTFAPISTSGKYRALGRPGGSFESDGGIGGYFLGEGLTSAELWTLYKTMKTFYTNIGRPMEAEGEKNSLRAYGDSMTAGAGSTSNANGWPTQYFAVDTNRMIGNFGVSGETASQIKDRLILDPSLETDTIVIMAGTNDYQGGASAVTNALTHISTMVAAVSSTGNPKWVVCTPPGSWLDTNVTVNYTYLISLCNGIASAYPNNYVDVRAAIIAAYNSGVPQDVTDHANDVTPSTLQATGDTPHLNDAGYAVVASTIKSFIDGKGW